MMKMRYTENFYVQNILIHLYKRVAREIWGIWFKKATAPYVKYGFEWLFREDD